jgi:CelD/BcsL family acetyltransferase involved in cellulose biosynthesis
MTSVRVVRRLDTGAWKRFVDEQPGANIFHTPEMFAVFERSAGHRPDLWAVVDDAGVHALFTPVHITLGAAMSRGFTTRSVAYGSVLARETEPRGDAVLTLFEQYADAMRRRSLFTELRNLQALDGLRGPLEQCSYAYEDHLNYLVDLDRPSETVFGSISSSTRKKIRRALRSGDVSVVELTARADLPAWYELMRQTYRRARVPLPHPSLFEAAFDVLRPQGMIKFFIARIGDVAVACSAELLYKDTIYGWYGGSDRDYSSYIPNDLLTWHVLEWGSENGYKVYDFGGAGKPDEPYGVRTFKAKYGGELVNYGRYVRVHSGVRLAVSKLAYRAYQSARTPLSPRGSARSGNGETHSNGNRNGNGNNAAQTRGAQKV